jgi:alpha-tubulin suppressor-like RCC1 family protein
MLTCFGMRSALPMSTVFHMHMVRLISLAATSFALLLACKPARGPSELGSTSTISASSDEPVASEARASKRRFVDIYLVSDPDSINHGCALEQRGALWCWGDDPALELDLRRATEHWMRASVVENLDPAVAVAGTENSTCVLLADGRLRCWGRRGLSGSFDWTTEFADVQTFAVEGVVVCIVAEGDVWCGALAEEPKWERLALEFETIGLALDGTDGWSIDRKGNVWEWDYFDMKKVPKVPPTQLVGVSEAKLLFPAWHDVEILRADGWVYRRGSGFSDEYKVRADITDVIDLALASKHGCAVTGDGKARCFGANGWAQLGDGSSTPREHVVDVEGITNAHGIAVLPWLSCALHDEDVSCWGTRLFGPDEQHVALRDAVKVVVDYGQTCATTSSGENLCWGYTWGVPFERDPGGIFASSRPQPLPFALGPLRELDSGCWQDELGVRVCGTMLGPDGEQVATVSTNFKLDSRDTGAIWSGGCVLRANTLECDDQAALPMPKLRRPSGMLRDGNVVCVIHAGGKVGCTERVRTGRTWAFTKLSEVPDLDSAHQLLGLHPSHYAALDRHGDVWTWRTGRDAQVGFVERLPLPMTGVTKIIRDREGLCGLTGAGELMCMDFRDDSINVRWTDVVDADGCWGHQCVVQRDGLLTCIGDNDYGQLGALPQTVMAQPMALAFENQAETP